MSQALFIDRGERDHREYLHVSFEIGQQSRMIVNCARPCMIFASNSIGGNVTKSGVPTERSCASIPPEHFARTLEEVRHNPPRAGRGIGSGCRCASQRGTARGTRAGHRRFNRILRTRSLGIVTAATGVKLETMGTPRRRTDGVHVGALPPRYSLVLNPYVRERFTKCPGCEAATRVRKLPLVVHVEHAGAPRLVLLNKTCRLCVMCETLIVDRFELEGEIIAAGLSTTGRPPDYVVIGTIDRRTWRRGLGGAAIPDIRDYMADFKKYVKVDVVPAHWGRASGSGPTGV